MLPAKLSCLCYSEKGGQIGDHGTIVSEHGAFEVTDTQYVGEAIAHFGRVISGSFAPGESVRTSADSLWRGEIRRHHTSAHLLQRALKDVIGDEVMQARSWVGIDRMRFDFRSPVGALSPAQKRSVTQRVNQFIRDDYHLETNEMSIAEAQQSGAISMAGEKVRRGGARGEGGPIG
jgi:alanyl-tRNA synthetase